MEVSFVWGTIVAMEVPTYKGSCRRKCGNRAKYSLSEGKFKTLYGGDHSVLWRCPHKFWMLVYISRSVKEHCYAVKPGIC